MIATLTSAEGLMTIYILYVLSYCGRVGFLESFMFLAFCELGFFMTKLKGGLWFAQREENVLI